MHPNDKMAFAKLITALSQLCKTPLNETDIGLYWHCLQEFTFSQVEEAFTNCLRDPRRKWGLPGIQDVVCYWYGDPKTQALEAWTKVHKAISVVGRYNSIVFDDLRIHAVIHAMGGWIKLGDLTEQQIPFYQREFQTRYESYVLHPPQDYPKVLSGLCELENHHKGYNLPSPSLYGDPQKALAVYQRGKTMTALITPLNALMMTTQEIDHAK